MHAGVHILFVGFRLFLRGSTIFNECLIANLSEFTICGSVGLILNLQFVRMLEYRWVEIRKYCIGFVFAP